MQDSANVSLSSFEKELVTNAEWILTKNGIIQKVNILFQKLAADYCNSSFIQQLPAEVKNILPKISKGENYEGLPYLVLDYPRHFGKENVFAVRTFFWWGNFFSITLHLKGIYKTEFEKKIAENVKQFSSDDLWMNVNNEEWIYHFDPTNMQPVAQQKISTENNNVLRLAYKLDLNNWDNAEEFLSKKFNQLLQLLS
jgi:hypothetical protein